MATRNDIIKIDETTTLEFKDDHAAKKWEERVRANTSSYEKGAIRFARYWAKYMQTLISEGKTVSEIAQQAADDADIEEITGYMYSQAVVILSECWKYGNELRLWYNKNHGYEGDGVAIPQLVKGKLC